MQKKLIFRIVLCAIMASLAIVLDKVSLDITEKIKITFYALPLIVVGITNGPIYGLLTGIVTGVVTQLTSKWGVGPTSVFWGLAPVAWGGISGLVTYLLKKTILKKKRIIIYIIAIIIASIFANLLNTFAMFMDTLLIRDAYYTKASILIDWPLRILVMVISWIPYVLVTYGVCTGLHYSFENDKEQ